ncbi:MAG: VWA domain-containing protein [Ignavibacteriales bacterium]|nr:VWA domain-containing protein [Ignavibacteriales bacterium]
MKTFAVALIVGLLAAGITQPACAHVPPGEKGIVVDGKVNCPYVPSSGGTIFLHLSITTPKFDVPKRKPLNLSIVLDRSGSMGDSRKIEYAKAALTTLVRQLTRDDILSIVIYDDVVEILVPARKVRDKREILHLVDEVYARGWTNLGGGMIEGFNQVEKNASRKYINRVILLSDGLANQGITEPRQLNTIARRYRSRSISLTTMGVGLDFNENLMVGLAEHGGGSYYFIESPHSIAHILHREFDALSTVLAQNAVLEIDLGRKAHLKDVIGHEWKEENGRYQVSLGDLYADNTSSLTLELDVKEGSGNITLAAGSLQYETDKTFLQDRPSFRTAVEYTSDATVVEQNRDMEVQARADIAVSTRKVEQAMEALDAGKTEEAARELDDAQRFLQASPAATAAGAGEFIREQKVRLESFEKILKDSSNDTRRAKKSIQYDNYRIQKNKN